MAIKLAFSTVACPEWTIEQVAERAKAMGYQGVDLRTLEGESSVIASDPAHLDLKKVRNTLAKAGIEACCLSTSLSLHYRSTTDGHRAMWQAKQYIQMASELGCSALRVFGHEVEPGENRRTVIQRIAERAQALADIAGDVGVRLLFENGGSINEARDWWWLFNLIPHPMIGLVWNVANSSAAGESPAVSVPALNSRIVIGKVKDTNVGEGTGYVPLGEGTVGVEHFVRRLMGIGFDGYVDVEWDRAWLPSLAPAEEYLPKAHETLKGWMDVINEARGKAEEKIAKRQAKEAPKKRAELQAKA